MATKKKARTPREKTPRQRHLPGTEPPTIKPIEAAAEDYVEKRDHRMELLTAEVKAKNNLQALMREHEIKVYEFDGYEITVDETATVHVKRKKQPKAEENGEGEKEESES